MNSLEKIESINKNLQKIRKNNEKEIEELIEKEIRELIEIFDKDNSNNLNLYAIAGMGGFNFYLETKDKELYEFKKSYAFDNLLLGLNHFNHYLKDYEINDYKLILSKELIEKFNNILKTIETISNKKVNYNFFNINDLDFDSREPTVYKILENNYESNINDETFLKLIACRNESWKHYLNQTLLKSFKEFKDEKTKIKVENKYFHNEFKMFKNMNYDLIVEFNKKLILTSNLFDVNTKLEDVKIELENNNSIFKEIRKFSDTINDNEKIFKLFNDLIQFGKPSEVYSNIEKKLYLNNIGLYNVLNENIDNKKSLLEEIDLIQDKYTKKIINFVETLDKNEVLDLIKKALILNFKIINKNNNTIFEKSFDNLEDLNNYLELENKDICFNF